MTLRIIGKIKNKGGYNGYNKQDIRSGERQ